MAELMGIVEYARHRDITHQSVSQAVDEGRISHQVVDGKRMIDPEVADREWAENTVRDTQEEKGITTSGQKTPDQLSYAKSKALKESINVQMAKLELDTKMGKLVSMDIVKQEFFNLSRTLRNSYLTVPDRVSGQCVGKTAEEIHLIITKEIILVLENLSKCPI